ncbi:MAG: L-threonine 3-dehydrogenase [Solobacterium sp.]|nr:L-threonine 3-dehydrogenase [Solobacterium sp.]
MTQHSDGMMWALVKEKRERGIWMRRVPVPKVGTNDVKIRIIKTAICGTDVHIYEWNKWAQHTIDTGRTIGHEYVGQIVETGPGARGFNVGDFVSGEGHITCGKCRNCMEGHKENCKNAEGVGVNRNGAFAEYLVIPYVNVWPCNPEIPLEMYSIFDPFGNATHAALSFDVLGEDVLIAGAGPIGCMAAGIVRFAGARHVVVTDFNPYRLDMAKKLGATTVVNLKDEKLEDVMKRIGMREGFDVGLEMSGSPKALNDMIHNMKHGGNIALLGLQEDHTDVDLETVIFNGINLRGIYGRKVWDTWYKMTTMLQAGLDISPIITHHFSAKDYEKGFEAMISGMSGKVILDWTHINEEMNENEEK